MNRHSFAVNSVICAFYIYKTIRDPVLGEELGTVNIIENPHHTLTLEVCKRMTVGICHIDISIMLEMVDQLIAQLLGLNIPCSLRVTRSCVRN